MLTTDLLKQICPLARNDRLAFFVDPLNAALDEFEVNTPKRQAAFLAQLAHESGSFRYVKELASGEAYEGRKDLGNTEHGDGVRYKGRGLIQITGRANYAACSVALFGHPSRLLTEPELLEQPESACRSAAWFWHSRKLSDLADVDDFIRITKRINGGTNGLADRQAYWERAKLALEV